MQHIRNTHIVHIIPHKVAHIGIRKCNEGEQRSSAYYAINHNRDHYSNGRMRR